MISQHEIQRGNENGRPDCDHTFWVRIRGAWVNQSDQGNVITSLEIGARG